MVETTEKNALELDRKAVTATFPDDVEVLRDYAYRAQGKIAFLMSCIRCGELLDEGDEIMLRKFLDEFDVPAEGHGKE